MANDLWGTTGVARATTGTITGSAYPSYASATDNNSYISILFAKKMLRLFYATAAYEEICNTDYEGEISKVGDQVVISYAPTMDISAYQVGQAIDYQVPVSTEVTLNIDKALYWAYTIQDIDKLQTHLNLMDEFAMNAAKQLTTNIDIDCLGYFTTKVPDAHKGATAGAISGDIVMGTNAAPVAIDPGTSDTNNDALQHLLDGNLVLDEANITGERFMVAPSWYVAYFKGGDVRRVDVTGDSTGVIRTGVLGKVDDTLVIKNNNMPSGTATNGPGTAGNFWTLFGTKEASTFAMQLTKTESLRIPNSFGDYHRGLSVYGREVVQPNCLALGCITKG